MLRSIALCVASIAAGLLTVHAFAQQTPAANPLKGAWQLTEIVGAPNGPSGTPFPSLMLFTDKHYSVWAILGPRPKFAPGQGSDADRLATFDAFAGNSGTYEVNGNIVIMHAMIGKNEYIVGSTQRAEFRIEGSTLVWSMPGGGMERKFTRLE